MRLFHNSKRGMVLVFVMFTGVLLVALLLVILIAFNATTGLITRSADDRQAYLNAKSGIEYAKSRLSQEVYQGFLPDTDFYIYGKPGDLTYTIGAPENESDYADDPVFVVCTGTVKTTSTGSSISVNADIGMVSYGQNDTSSVCTLTYDCTLSISYAGAGPLLPSTLDPSLIDGSHMAWYSKNSSGQLVLNANAASRSLSGAAVFPDTVYVNNNGQSNKPLMADSIYFMLSDTSSNSIYSSQNRKVYLSANYFAFYGNIVFQYNDSNTYFQIEPCNSAYNASFSPLITGAKLIDTYGVSGVSRSVDYGIVYFAPGAQIMYYNSGTGKYPVTVNMGGSGGTFYFMPRSVVLSSITASNLRGLVKINDLMLIKQITGGDLIFSFSSSPLSVDIGGTYR